MGMCHGACVVARGKACRVRFFFHLMSSGNQTEVISLGGNCLYLLKCLSSYQSYFYHISNCKNDGQSDE